MFAYPPGIVITRREIFLLECKSVNILYFIKYTFFFFFFFKFERKKFHKSDV